MLKIPAFGNTRTVQIRNNVVKSLERINEPYYSAIKKAIYGLSDNPRPKGYKKLKGRDGYRIRISDYRIIYDIFDTILIVRVLLVGHRKDAYN